MTANHPPSSHPLRVWRQARGLTLDALGRQLGVSKHALSNYETGRRFPRPATLAAITRITSGAVTANDFLACAPSSGEAAE